MALRQRKPRARSPLPDGLGLRRHHEDAAREVAARFQAQDRWPQQLRSQDLASPRGGHKQQYRIIDFRRNKDAIPARVAAIEYDPNRTCRIALLHYLDGEKRYILAPNGLKVDDMVESGPRPTSVPATRCDALHPTGSTVHNVELRPGARQDGAQRRHGCPDRRQRRCLRHTATSSTEMRRVPIDCRATLGTVGNSEHELTSIGKAGRNRWKGVRPQTRGVAMNPVDHPSVVAKARRRWTSPVSPWASRSRTRLPKASDKLIIRRRRDAARGGR